MYILIFSCTAAVKSAWIADTVSSLTELICRSLNLLAPDVRQEMLGSMVLRGAHAASLQQPLEASLLKWLGHPVSFNMTAARVRSIVRRIVLSR